MKGDGCCDGGGGDGDCGGGGGDGGAGRKSEMNNMNYTTMNEYISDHE